MSLRREGACTPLGFERNAPPPSPAQSALQGNLDGDRTVTKKKSWFGSARDMLSKRIPILRGEADEDEKDKEDREQSEETRGIQLDRSCVDDRPTTPLRPRSQRQRTFTPKSGVKSLRQHMSGSRDRRKRGALANITGNEGRLPADPGAFTVTGPEEEDTYKKHARRTSLGRSLVGSIRSFSRHAIPTKPLVLSRRDPDDLVSPTRRATKVPLPSSPIHIPPPPTLDLDLGPSALVSPTFGRCLDLDEGTQVVRSTNPGIIVTQVPTYCNRISGEGPTDPRPSLRERRSLQPSDLLQLPTDDFGPGTLAEPMSPLPGINARLEIDGTNDPSEIFERSLEYKDKAKKKQNRKLKKMVSLDAMADECASKSRCSPAEKSTIAGGDVSQSIMSADTVRTCPDGFSELTRQTARLQSPHGGSRDAITGQWKSEDPFASGNAISNLTTSGPPSPERDVKLPFRPKIKAQTAESNELRTLTDDLRLLPPTPRPKQHRDEAGEFSANQPSSYTGHSPREVVRGAAGQSGSVTEIFEEKRPNGSSDDLDSTVVFNDHSENAQAALNESGEYSEFKTQHIFGDLREEDNPEYDDAANPGAMTAVVALRHTPSVKQIYERISKSNTSSPQSLRARTTTHAVDIGDVFWKFNAKDWMKGPDDGTPTSDSPAAPQYLSRGVNIDSASERHVQAVSPEITTMPDRPSMGNRLELELKRSNRNMRYNALSDMDIPEHESMATSLSAMPLPLRPNTRVVNEYNFDMDDVRSDSSNTPSSKDWSKRCGAGMSSDSIEGDLREIIADHYVFRHAMVGSGIPSPSSIQALRDEDELHSDDTRYLSPSDSSIFWQELQQSMFDTPPAKYASNSPFLNHQRESGEMNYDERNPEAMENQNLEVAKPVTVKEEDTLDECLEMFRNYNKGQKKQPLDANPSGEKLDDPFSSPASGSTSNQSLDNPASARKKKPQPARYRSSRPIL